MIGDSEELNNYIINDLRLSRKGLNILCFIGMFIFGWLLVYVFLTIGKKGKGWFYIIIIGIIEGMALSKHGHPALFILAFIVYLIGWIHANLILSRYQTLARQRIVNIETQQPSVDVLLEKGLLYWEVLGEKQSAHRSFTEAISFPEGGNAQMFNRAGILLFSGGKVTEAATYFNRALSLSRDAKETEQIKKNLEAALKKTAKSV